MLEWLKRDDPYMRVTCVELTEFECDLIQAFARQSKSQPVATGLCRAIYRRMEGQPAFARSHIDVKEKNPLAQAAIVGK